MGGGASELDPMDYSDLETNTAAPVGREIWHAVDLTWTGTLAENRSVALTGGFILLTPTDPTGMVYCIHERRPWSRVAGQRRFAGPPLSLPHNRSPRRQHSRRRLVPRRSTAQARPSTRRSQDASIGRTRICREATSVLTWAERPGMILPSRFSLSACKLRISASWPCLRLARQDKTSKTRKESAGAVSDFVAPGLSLFPAEAGGGENACYLWLLVGIDPHLLEASHD
jgi:hypothetical protein